MIIEVTTIYNDGYISAKIINEENYLSFMYKPIEGWMSVFGKLDNRNFKKDSLNLSWKAEGRGKAKEETLKKVYEMQRIFIKYIPSTKEIKEGKTMVIISE